jgi:hypothetical protein
MLVGGGTRTKGRILKLTLASIFIVVSKFAGLVGAIIAIPLLWSDHRWLAVAALATVAVQLLPKAPPLVANLSAAGGTGLFVFALVENAWLAIVVAVLEIVLSFVLGKLVRDAFDHMRAEIIADSGLSPERIRRIQALGTDDTAAESPTSQP